MLSTVFAAETQFRHETEQRAREFAILGSIRDRKEALAASDHARIRAPAARVAAPDRVAATDRRQRCDCAGATPDCAS